MKAALPKDEDGDEFDQLSARVLARKLIRWVLLRLPGGHRILNARRKSRQAKGTAPGSAPESISGPMVSIRLFQGSAVRPRWRFSTRRWSSTGSTTGPARPLCMPIVPFTKRRSKRFARSSGISAGRRSLQNSLSGLVGARTYDTTCLAESISTTDVDDADSLVVGIPYKNQLYSVAVEGGAEILPLQRLDERLVARDWSAGKVDWTGAFAARKQHRPGRGTNQLDNGIFWATNQSM